MKSNKGLSKNRQTHTKDDKVVISSEYYENDRPFFICSICNRTLSRLSDAGGNNSTYWCHHCSVEFDPESENIRRESKISVPDRNVEPAIATTPGQDYLDKKVQIRHEPELKDGALALSKKGTIKFTHYEEREG
jgi:hypothetical protein